MVRCSKIWWLGAVLGALAGACSSTPPQCEVGSDCPSGACRQDGTCVVTDTDATGSGSGDATTSAGSSTTGDASTGAGDASGDGSTDTGQVGCLPPNADGLIERDEVPLQAGLDATFLVATDVPVNTQGASNPDGGYTWDFDIELGSDHLMAAETQSLSGRWFEPLFPGATYAARLTDASDLLGVFEATDTALLLRGVVSPDDGLTRTELTYDPPVTVLRFPLQVGATWETTSNVSGLAQGVAALYTETYENEIDAHGEAYTPYGDFAVLRVGVVLTRVVGTLPTVVRTYAFVAECFGTIASIRSLDNESAEEFTQAAELRRLTP